MSAFKQLNAQDVFVKDYLARKQWDVSGSATGSYNIHTLRGLSSSIAAYTYPQDKYKGQYQSLVFNSVDHLFFRDSFSDQQYSGSRELNLQSTLSLSGSRRLQNEVAIINIPRKVYGVGIEPKTFVLKPEAEASDFYASDGYSIDSFSGDNSYFERPHFQYGSNPINTEDYIVSESSYVSESLEGEYVDIDQDQQRIEVVDDGEGRLVISGALATFTNPLRIVGDINYNQGLIMITDPIIARYYSTYNRHHLRWKSNQPIYTYNVYCRIKDSEMNFTLNPSATSGSNGILQNNVTGSSFNPYITSVGLYNSSNELLAVAKTNRPIPKSDSIETTFVVKLDI
jgi:hypothetical protein